MVVLAVESGCRHSTILGWTSSVHVRVFHRVLPTAGPGRNGFTILWRCVCSVTRILQVGAPGVFLWSRELSYGGVALRYLQWIKGHVGAVVLLRVATQIC